MARGFEAFGQGVHIGNAIGAPINQAFDRIAQQRFAQEQQQRQQDFLRQQATDEFKKQLLLASAANPDLAQALMPVQPGQTVDGQASVKPLPLTSEQQIALASGGRPPDSPTLNLAGFALDPQRLKQLQIEDETRKAANQIRVNNALYAARPQLSTIVDPLTGQVSIIDKKSQTASAVNGGNQIVSPKLTEAEIVDPKTGIKSRVKVDGAGNVVSTIGTSGLPQGKVVTDPVTGEVSVVNPTLPQGVGPGQATSTTQAASEPEPKPFKVGVKPTTVQTQMGKEVRQLDDAFDTLESLKTEYNALAESGKTGLMPGLGIKAANLVTGGAAFPEAQSYLDLRDAFIARIKNLTGDVGVMTDQDAVRIQKLISDITRDPAVARKNFAMIEGVVQRAKERRAGSQGQVQGASTVQTQSSGPGTASDYLKKFQ